MVSWRTWCDIGHEGIGFGPAACVSLLLSAVLLVCLPAPALATEGVILTAVTGMDQTGRVDELLPQRFSVRVTDIQGRLLPGARIWFGNNWCMGYGYPGECPFNSAFGSFQWPGEDHWVAADADGLAVAPPYMAGPRPGHLSVLAFAPSEEPPYYFPLGSTLDSMPVFHFVQVTSVPIPARDGLWVIGRESNGQPGRGFQLETHGQVMVLTFFGYEPGGRGTFFVTSGALVDNMLVGPLNRYRGGTYFGGAWRTAEPDGSAGPVSIAFSGNERGTIQLPGEPIRDIRKFNWSASPAIAGAPETGLWVIASELDGRPGRGLQLEVQDQTLVMTVFAYERSGDATFYLASGPLLDGGSSAVLNLNQYRDGISFGGPVRDAKLAGNAGLVKLRFTEPTRGFIQLPGEGIREVVKYSW